jgi:hypothetical protein
VGVMVPPFSDTAANNNIYTAKSAYQVTVYPSGDADRVAASLKLMEFFFRPATYQKWIDASGITPAEPNITVKGTVAQAIATLASKSTTATDYEQLSITGAVWNQTDVCDQVIAGTMTPEKAVSTLKQAFDDSKPDWK